MTPVATVRPLLGVVNTLQSHLDGLRAAVNGVDPAATDGTDAAELVRIGVALERFGASLRTRFALRVEVTGAFSETGHKHAAGWLAGVSGESVGQAHDVLKTAARLAEAPLVEQAFKDGKLSLSQAGVAASAGAIDPSAQRGLVRTATSGSMKELKDEVFRIKRAADGARGEASFALKEARAQRGRYLRTRVVPEGGMKLEAWLPTADGARVKAALKAEADRIFKEAWAAGVKERPDAYLADALVRAVCGERKNEPKAEVAVRVDLGTLRRGFVEGDETCEIAGVGPIPVEVAKDLLGDAVFHVVVTDGVDVKAVTSKKRTIPASLRRALMERDRTCAVPGCDATEHLQIDHRWDFAKGGPTQFSNLSRLCTAHHRMKTTAGFRLVKDGDDIRWLGPDEQRRWADGEPGP